VKERTKKAQQKSVTPEGKKQETPSKDPVNQSEIPDDVPSGAFHFPAKAAMNNVFRMFKNKFDLLRGPLFVPDKELPNGLKLTNLRIYNLDTLTPDGACNVSINNRGNLVFKAAISLTDILAEVDFDYPFLVLIFGDIAIRLTFLHVEFKVAMTSDRIILSRFNLDHLDGLEIERFCGLGFLSSILRMLVNFILNRFSEKIRTEVETLTAAAIREAIINNEAAVRGMFTMPGFPTPTPSADPF